jgi:hypothetical protein
MTPSGIELMTFWLVVQCLNQLHHHAPYSNLWLVKYANEQSTVNECQSSVHETQSIFRILNHSSDFLMYVSLAADCPLFIYASQCRLNLYFSLY